MYLKKSINYKIHEDVFFSTPDIEALVVTLQMDQCRKFLIIVCYRTPQGNVDSFIEALAFFYLDASVVIIEQ